MVIKRVKSGIPGLDKLLGGGFVKGGVNLITGKTGAGKTLACLQIMKYGALHGEPGIYLTTEETREDLINDASASFGWNLKKLEKDRLIKIVEIDPLDISDLVDKVDELRKDINAERVFIDSTSMLGLYNKTPFEARIELFKLAHNLKKQNLTVFMSDEILENASGDLSRFGVVEFVADTVIIFNFLIFGSKYSNVITVRKMRRSKHDKRIHPLIFTKKGLVVEIHKSNNSEES